MTETDRFRVLSFLALLCALLLSISACAAGGGSLSSPPAQPAAPSLAPYVVTPPDVVE